MKIQERNNKEIVEELLDKAKAKVKPSTPLSVYAGHPENVYLVSFRELEELRFAAGGSINLRARTDYPESYSHAVFYEGYLFACDESEKLEQAVA